MVTIGEPHYCAPFFASRQRLKATTIVAFRYDRGKCRDFSVIMEMWITVM